MFSSQRIPYIALSSDLHHGAASLECTWAKLSVEPIQGLTLSEIGAAIRSRFGIIAIRRFISYVFCKLKYILLQIAITNISIEEVVPSAKLALNQQ